MRKFIAILCATALFMSSFTVMGAISDGDSDGDVVDNPWKELFTTEAGQDTTTKQPDTTTTQAENPTTKPSGETGQQNANNAAVDDAALMASKAIDSAVADAVGKFKVIVKEGSVEVVNIQEPGFATAAGIYVTFSDADLGDMTVNGAALSKDVQGAGVIMHLSNFQYKFSEVVVKDSSNGTKAVLYVYNEDGIDNKTGEAATTTQKQEDQTTTAKEDDQTTTAKEDDQTTTVKPDETTKAPSYDAGFNPADLTYTEVPCTGDDSKEPLGYAAKDGATIEGLNPWYGDAGNTFMLQFADPNNESSSADITVNGEQPKSGVITEKAQGLVKINPHTLPDDSYTVVTVTLSSGKTATFVIKKGNPSDEQTPTTKQDNPTTTAKTDDQTTTAKTDDQTTTAASTAINMDQSFTATGNYTLGGYDIYVGDWNGSTAIGGVDPKDPDHVMVQQKTSNWGEAWGTQVTKKLTGLNPGAVYTVEWPINAASNDGKVKVTDNDAEIALVGGAQTLTGTFTADDTGAGSFTVGMGWVGLANPIEFYQPTIKDANGNVVYPGGSSENPTTKQNDNPTTSAVDGTTPGVTTTATDTVTTTATNPTTVAPTVAPTGKTVVNAKVGKTKVKKATKKAAAKKIKVSLKKIGGAAGYQVRVFKAKKDAKKNKKAIVKKTIKKASATIKSKKLANKAKLFVRARAYKLIGGAKKYGKWSAVKKAKVK